MFRIGEFSKLCQVSKRLLHHYDEKGLLSPAHVDASSGYRFYTTQQIPVLNRILALKELGLSLDQIKAQIQTGVSDEQIRGMLLLRESEVEQTLQKQQLQLQKIRTRIALNARQVTSPDIVMKQLPEQHYIGFRRTYQDPTELMLYAQQTIVQLGHRLQKTQGATFTACVYSETFTLDNQDIQLGFALPSLPSETLRKPLLRPDDKNTSLTDVEFSLLPEIKEAACTVLIGAEDAILQGLNQIAFWLSEMGYIMDGPYREVILEWPEDGNMAHAAIEIQVPVRRRQDN